MPSQSAFTAMLQCFSSVIDTPGGVVGVVDVAEFGLGVDGCFEGAR
jgi:hypothetical protein